MQICVRNMSGRLAHDALLVKADLLWKSIFAGSRRRNSRRAPKRKSEEEERTKKKKLRRKSYERARARERRRKKNLQRGGRGKTTRSAPKTRAIFEDQNRKTLPEKRQSKSKARSKPGKTAGRNYRAGKRKPKPREDEPNYSLSFTVLSFNL